MAFRTQKISQRTPKGANLEATDLIEVSTIESGSYVTRSITGQEIIDAAVGNVDWGDIGGTLSAQTDLQTALNAKQNTLSLTTTGSSGASTLVGSTLNVPNYTLSGLGGVPTSRTLTINGVTQDLSADRTFTISTGITIGSTAIASGTVGRILFEGLGNVVQESSSLFWDNTNNRLGIGTSTPTRALQVSYSDNAYLEAININNTNTGTQALSGVAFTVNGVMGGFMSYQPSNYVLAAQASTKVFSSVSTNRLAFIANSNASGVAQDIYFSTLGSNTTYQMQIKGNTGNVQIGTNTDAGFRLDVNGTARVSGNLTLNNTSGTNRSTDIRTSNSIDNFPTTTFYPSSGTNVGQSFQVIPRGTGFSAGIKAQFAISGTDTIADGTNFEAMVVRATGSAFTFSSGKGGTGTIRPLLFSAGFLDGVTNPNQLWLYSTGNVGINTNTDAGFRLDVNGTARVQSTLTASSGLTISAGTFNITTTTNLYTRNNNFYINSFVPSGGTISGIILSPSSGSFTNTGAGGTSRGDLFVSATNIATSVGNVTLNHFVVQNDINNTAATSLIRGFYYNPTLTSVVGTTHYAFHSTSGLIRFENLPTSAAGLPTGTLYNNLGVLMIA